MEVWKFWQTIRALVHEPFGQLVRQGVVSTTLQNLATDWRMVGSGSLGDTPDIMVEKALTTGAKAVWIMVLLMAPYLFQWSDFYNDANYRIVGCGDFNSDGQTDIVAEEITSNTAFDAQMQENLVHGMELQIFRGYFLTFKQEWKSEE